MLKKIILIVLLNFLFIQPSFANYGDTIYINKSDTKVYFDLNKKFNLNFNKGYFVKDLGENIGDYKKVLLTSGVEAYINKSNLDGFIDSSKLLNNNAAILLSEKFPLFLEPNIYGKTDDILTKNTKFSILHNVLINDIWVKVKIEGGELSGKEGYMWYKTLKFFNDVNMVSFESPFIVQGNNIVTTNNNVLEVKTQEETSNKNSDFYKKIINLREDNPIKYSRFIDKMKDLKYDDIDRYYKILEEFELYAPFILEDLENISDLDSNSEDYGDIIGGGF